jgi:hypothetical protein
MKGLKLQSKKKLTRIEIINNYISGANMVINTAQNAINNPTAKNFEVAEHTYGVWVLDIHKFLKDFDEKKAQLFISDLDGVRTHLLNSLEERSGNVIPQVGFFREEDGVIYADESGIRMLQSIISSVKGKVIFLDHLKLEITGGTLPNRNTKKVMVIVHKSGKIKTSIDNQSMQRRKGSIIMGVIYKIREMEGIKLASLSKDLRASDSNISRDIKVFNDEVIEKWKLNENVIVNESGYRMNKDSYNFYYDDL